MLIGFSRICSVNGDFRSSLIFVPFAFVLSGRFQDLSNSILLSLYPTNCMLANLRLEVLSVEGLKLNVSKTDMCTVYEYVLNWQIFKLNPVVTTIGLIFRG